MQTNCDGCGKAITIRPSRRQRSQSGLVFCSPACSTRHPTVNQLRAKPRYRGSNLTCPVCRTVFYRKRAELTGSNCCSRRCTGIFVASKKIKGQHHVPVVCRNCGITTFWPPHRARKRLYCSMACQCAYRRTHQAGDQSPFWMGGPKTYRGRAWLAIRAVVVVEQNGCCATCGRFVGTSLPVHHKRPFREFTSADAANERANLEGLCQSCHMHTEPRRKAPLSDHKRTP